MNKIKETKEAEYAIRLAEREIKGWTKFLEEARKRLKMLKKINGT